MTAQDEPPQSVGGMIANWVFVGVLLGLVPLFGASLRVTDLIEVVRVDRGPAGTVAVTAGTCDHDDNYDVVCAGRFVPDDPRLPAHAVTLLTADVSPAAQVRAREAGPDSARAWADDYQPAWGHWIVFVALFGGFGTLVLVLLTRTTVGWRRVRRKARNG